MFIALILSEISNWNSYSMNKKQLMLLTWNLKLFNNWRLKKYGTWKWSFWVKVAGGKMSIFSKLNGIFLHILRTPENSECLYEICNLKHFNILEKSSIFHHLSFEAPNVATALSSRNANMYTYSVTFFVGHTFISEIVQSFWDAIHFFVSKKPGMPNLQCHFVYAVKWQHMNTTSDEVFFERFFESRNTIANTIICMNTKILNKNRWLQVLTSTWNLLITKDSYTHTQQMKRFHETKMINVDMHV